MFISQSWQFCAFSKCRDNEEYLEDLFSVGALNKEFVHSNQLINTITLIDEGSFFTVGGGIIVYGA